MESNEIPDVSKPPSPGEVILQQRKDAAQAAGQSAGDGSFWSQFSNNPFFTAVWHHRHPMFLSLKANTKPNRDLGLQALVLG